MSNLWSNATVTDESHIVWLKPKDDYDYLREGEETCNYRKRFPLKKIDPARITDGGPKSHIVAYAVLKPTAGRARRSVHDGFIRRYWWVKSYDRWEGSDPGVYSTGAPCEAVMVGSIKAGVESVGWR